MENIVKFEKHVEKICGTTEFKDRIHWDFILSLPENIDNSLDDKNHILEQIKYGCLPKISVVLMN